MYENFTDRARAVMQLANQEAQRLNHTRVRTEHMLLGLAKEGSGVAANVLKNLDLDLGKIRLEVEKLVPAGGTMQAIGKMPLSTAAENAGLTAIAEAMAVGDSHVGTEHLLLGLMREVENVAVQVVENLGVTPDSIIKDIHHLLGVGDASEPVAPRTATIYVSYESTHDFPEGTATHPDVIADNQGRFVNMFSDSLIAFTHMDGATNFINMKSVLGFRVVPDKAVEPNGE